MEKGNPTLKLLVDKENKKVLFAEVGKEVVDFLFSILALPLATVAKLLADKGMVGSMGNLYDTLERLDGTYMLAGFNKDTLLKPTIPPNTPCQSTFFLESSSTQPSGAKTFYRCEGRQYCSNWSNHVTDGAGVSCPSCNRPMTAQLSYVPPNPEMGAARDAAGEGYVQGVVTYMVMDDLAVEPMSAISCITFLNKFKIEDVSSLEERNVQLGLEEGLLMLKAALRSKTILSDVFLRRTVSILEIQGDPLF